MPEIANKDAEVTQAVAMFRRRLEVKLAARRTRAAAARVREIFEETGLGDTAGMEGRAARTRLVAPRTR